MLSALSNRRHHAFLLLVVLLGVGLSVLAFKPAQTWAMHRVQDDFRRDARDIILPLEKNIDAHLGVLGSIGSLYAASDFVRRDEFQTFVRHGMLQRGGIEEAPGRTLGYAAVNPDHRSELRDGEYPQPGHQAINL